MHRTVISPFLVVAAALFAAACGSKKDDDPPRGSGRQGEMPCHGKLMAGEDWFQAVLDENPPLHPAEVEIVKPDPASGAIPARAPTLVVQAGEPPRPFAGDYLAIFPGWLYYASAAPGDAPIWHPLDPDSAPMWAVEIHRLLGPRATRPALLVAVDEAATWGSVKQAMAGAAASGYGATWFLFAAAEPALATDAPPPSTVTAADAVKAHCKPLAGAYATAAKSSVRQVVQLLARRLTDCECAVDLDALRSTAWSIRRQPPLSHVDIVLAAGAASTSKVQDASTMGTDAMPWKDAATFVVDRAHAPVFFTAVPGAAP